MSVGWKSQCMGPVRSVCDLLGWAECDRSCGGPDKRKVRGSSPFWPKKTYIYIYIYCFLGRRRPFLIRPLENTLIKLLRSLDFYDELGRTKIAMGAPLLCCCVRARLFCAV